jgi:hypothetical protein
MVGALCVALAKADPNHCGLKLLVSLGMDRVFEVGSLPLVSSSSLPNDSQIFRIQSVVLSP